MFQKITVHSSRKTVLAGCADTDLFPIEKIAALPCSMERDPETLLKNGSSTVAYLDGEIFVKCNPARSLFDSLRKNFKKSRAENSKVMAEKLLFLNIPTPRAICAIRERRGLFVICDYLATVALPKKSTVFLNRIIDFDRSEQSCLLTEIARILLLLNRNHICHGDASLRNFFFDKEQKSVGTIDLDGCKMLFPLQKKKSLICEAARAISSFMICTQDVSEDNYKFASQIFSGVCGKDLLPEKELKRATDIFLKKTRNHYFKAS